MLDRTEAGKSSFLEKREAIVKEFLLIKVTFLCGKDLLKKIPIDYVEIETHYCNMVHNNKMVIY